MSLGPHPAFAWSLSRHRTLEACERRYYWDVYGFWEGWEEDAPEEARRAYRLKQLSNLDFALGAAIHRRAAELVHIARAGRELPSAESLYRKTRAEVGKIYRTRLERFRRDPKNHPMLHSFYYGDGPDEAALERLREKLRTCPHQLRDLDLWSKIRSLDLRVVHAEEPDRRQEPQVRVDDTPVYANPDLVLWDDAERSYTVVDWKTGEPRQEDERQIRVYGLFVRQVLGADACRGRIVYLLDGSSRIVELTADVLDETATWISESIDRQRDYVADPELNRARERGAFELASDRWNCRWCNFFELCEEELRARGPLPWEAGS